MSYKRQELLTLREHMGSPSVFGGARVARLYSFMCCGFFFVFFLFVFVLSFVCRHDLTEILLKVALITICLTQCCQCLWTVHSWLPLRFSLRFIYCGKTSIGWRKCFKLTCLSLSSRSLCFLEHLQNILEDYQHKNKFWK